MKKLLLIALAILATVPAFAQSTPILNLKVTGTLNGTPSGGTLNLSNLTLTLPTVSISLPDGATGSPSISFASAPTTGFYYSGGSTYYTSGGVTYWRFAGNTFLTQTGTGTIIPGVGSVGNPCISDYNDGGTGLYFPGSSVFAVASNGVLKFSVRSTGVRCVLPTSSSGLSSGDLWNNSGVVNIVP